MKTQDKYRLVWGTRINKWVLVTKEDRDWKSAVTISEFIKLGSEKSKEKYLSPSLV